MTRTNESATLELKLTRKERALLSNAAEQRFESMDEFVLRNSLEAAEIECLEHPLVLVPSKDWDRFESWMQRPTEAIEGLVQLTKRKPSWRK